MIPARGYVKDYRWGKTGEESYIARFEAVAPKTPTKVCINNNTIDEGYKSSGQQHKHLAELWFGSHPSGPSTLLIDNRMVKLDDFLAVQPEMIGNVNQYVKYNKQLPFLFKLLSIAQPLSLQAHPDKKLAQVLHKNDPKNYPDTNHKPELAIALTEFQVLCDFRPHSEIAHFIREIAPFRAVIGDSVCSEYLNSLSQADPILKKKALGVCFKSLMMQDKEIVSEQTKQLLAKCSTILGQDLFNVIAHLESLYKGDAGIFAPLFLNYLKLAPGQAIYLKANKLHAYLKGECIECMACSDNVVRAGLTTKYRDIKTLTSMLDYETVDSSQDLIYNAKTTQFDGGDCAIDLFAPAEDFKVERIVINNKQEHSLLPVSSGSFIIVLGGKATTKNFFEIEMRHKLGFGSAGFVPPRISVKLSDIQGKLTIYRAFC